MNANTNRSNMKRSVLCSLIAFVSGSIFFLNVPTGMAVSYSTPSTEYPIMVELDKNSYHRGDIMFISGEVKAVVNRIPLTIQIMDPDRNLIHVEQIDVASDGKFSLPIKIEGRIWHMPGTYTLVVQYGFKHVSAMVKFQFEETEIPTTGIFNVKDISSGQNFDLNYTITGGIVKRMYIEPQDLALVVELDSKNSGMIHLPIPRLLLDAKKSNNHDESFLVFVNDAEVTSFHEEQVDSTSRVLAIPISEGDAKIEIIGTTIVPEFPFTLLVLVIAIFSIVVISRINHNLKI